MTKSWRTTLFGTGGLITILVSILNSYLDGNPLTNPDWAALVPAILASFGLLFTRDNKVTSEEAGAVPPIP